MEAKTKAGFYIVAVWGDIEPEILGPFATEEEQIEKADELRQDDRNGTYCLDIDSDGKPSIV